jgi:hypothetical protein
MQTTRVCCWRMSHAALAGRPGGALLAELNLQIGWAEVVGPLWRIGRPRPPGERFAHAGFASSPMSKRQIAGVGLHHRWNLQDNRGDIRGGSEDLSSGGGVG